VQLTAIANALAESFVDSYKTELIADRVWRSRAELELATVVWVAWFNHDRLHSSLGDIPPVEFEQNHAIPIASEATIPGNGSVEGLVHRPADGLTTSRVSTIGVDPSRVGLGKEVISLKPRPTTAIDDMQAAGLSDVQC
jgi:hypothetical protein